MKLSLNIEQGQISYHSEGKGPALLLLHSLGVSGEAWSQVIEQLARNYTVYAPDMLGHGDSDKPPRDYSVEDYAQSIVDFMGKLQLEKAILCGNSVGALIALEIASSHPSAIEKLLLVGCPAWDTWQRMERFSLAALNYDLQGTPLPLSSADVAVSYKKVTPELVEWVNSQRAKAGIWVKKTQIAVSIYDPLPKLQLVKCPTLVLFGSHDILRDREHILLDGIKRAELAIVENAGHLPQIDNPEVFLERVNKFLSSS